MANKMVERIVTGPKSVWIPSEDGNGRRLAEIGELITVSQRAADAFSDRLKDVAVAKAEQAVAKASAAARGEEAPEADEDDEDDDS